MPIEPTVAVGIIGAGTMGAGIAQVALEAGAEVLLYDADPVAVGRGRARVRDGLERRAARLQLDADSIEAWVEGRLERLRDADDLTDLAVSTGIVIEAAVEDLAVKREIFRTLDRLAARDAILATNTSALSVGSIAERTDDPGRILGLHFFNPAPVMRLVEVVVAGATRRETVSRAMGLVESWGKVPVRCADTPGFIVNRVNRPFTLEALRIVDTGSAGVESVDMAMRGAGYPMGPFELMDLIGIDVNLAAAIAIFDRLGSPVRLEPSARQYLLVDEGHLGRKTGQGFYVYDGEGRKVRADQREPILRVLGDDAIVGRIEAAILDEAERAAAEGVATEADIDLALRLGAGHPTGPFERARSSSDVHTIGG